MKTRPVTDEEWEEFCQFMNEWQKEQDDKKEKLHDSFFYSIYEKVKELKK